MTPLRREDGTSRISKAAVWLDECASAFPHVDLEGFLPAIQHWVQVALEYALCI